MAKKKKPNRTPKPSPSKALAKGGKTGKGTWKKLDKESGERGIEFPTANRAETPSILGFEVPRERAQSYSRQKGDMVEEMLRKGAPDIVAAASVGWTMDTVFAHMKARPDFRLRLKKAVIDSIMEMVGNIRRAAGETRAWTAGGWWLERSLPELFSLRREAHVKHEHVVKVVSNLPRPSRAQQDALQAKIVDAEYEVKDKGRIEDSRLPTEDTGENLDALVYKNVHKEGETSDDTTPDATMSKNVHRGKAKVREGVGPADDWP